MSTLRVEIRKIDNVLPHPNADRMAVLVLGGHRTCTALREVDGELVCPYQPGDPVLYVPPDAVLPQELAEEWGVANYLASGNRVKTVKLRGFVSRGFVVPVPKIDVILHSVGTDLAAQLGITKYEPPMPTSANRVPEHPAFFRYTNIERVENYPDVLEGQEVIVTEKIHGTNSRVASVVIDGNYRNDRFICGTHRTQVALGVGDLYETPLNVPGVIELLHYARLQHRDADAVVLFGELYGAQVQGRFVYDASPVGYRAFDLAVDGVYWDHACFLMDCELFNVPTVPVLYEGLFDIDVIAELADGPTTLGGNHIREGVVIRPTHEQYHPELGRVILKRIGDSYECKQYEWSDSH